MSEEIWKDIPGYEGYYQASTEGHIRSLDRWIESSNQHGTYTKLIKGVMLALYTVEDNSSNKYRQTRLHIEGIRKDCSVAALILKTFVGKPSDDTMVATFLDHNTVNTKLNNLKWVTRSRAVRCSVCRGSRGVSKADIKYIKKNPKNLKLQDLADLFSISVPFVHNIQGGQRYDYIK